MTVRDFMASWDARIFDAAIVKDIAIIGGQEVKCAFFIEPRSLQLPGGDFRQIGISFECRYVEIIGFLTVGDLIEIKDRATYRFLSEVIPGGDESGLTIVELGELL